MRREEFGQDFVWGVSTAAYQIEGAHNIDGKGPSIWDTFSNKKGNTFKNQNGNIACDHYHRYKEDIDLMASMGIKNYRLSFSWSRIFPDGIGKINSQGVYFYDNLIAYMLEKGITPWVTLYHWDLPFGLEVKGGWTNRDVLNWFANYAEFCTGRWGKVVKHWMVLNEPMVFTGAGYFLGVHAPGKKGLKSFLSAMHHATLAQGIGGRIIRSNVKDALIGTTYSCSHIDPYSDKEKDINAAKRVDALLNRLYIEPILGLGYPVKDLPVFKKAEKYMLPDDEKNMAFDFDFIGVQNYTREIVQHSYFTPYLKAKLVKAENRNVPITTMRWEVYPESIYNVLKKYDAYEGVKKVLITENGAAFPDECKDNQVRDTQRTEYLKNYIAQVLKAKNEGVNVGGYFIWTFTDNFEWSEGFEPRFGIVHVDFETQKRVIKDSGKWFKQFLTSVQVSELQTR